MKFYIKRFPRELLLGGEDSEVIFSSTKLSDEVSETLKRKKLSSYVIWYDFKERSSLLKNYLAGRILILNLGARLGDRNLEVLKHSPREGFEICRTKGEVGEGRTSSRRYRQIGDDEYETDTDSNMD